MKDTQYLLSEIIPKKGFLRLDPPTPFSISFAFKLKRCYMAMEFWARKLCSFASPVGIHFWDEIVCKHCVCSLNLLWSPCPWWPQSFQMPHWTCHRSSVSCILTLEDTGIHVPWFCKETRPSADKTTATNTLPPWNPASLPCMNQQKGPKTDGKKRRKSPGAARVGAGSPPSCMPGAVAMSPGRARGGRLGKKRGGSGRLVENKSQRSGAVTLCPNWFRQTKLHCPLTRTNKLSRERLNSQGIWNIYLGTL